MLNVSLFCNASSGRLPAESRGWSVVARSVHGKEEETASALQSIAAKWAPAHQTPW